MSETITSKNMSEIRLYDNAGGLTEGLRELIGGLRAFAIIDSALARTAVNVMEARNWEAAGGETAGVPSDPWTGLFGDNVIWLEADEGLKGLECVEAIGRTMLEKGVDRSWMLVGIGGGITTDITGFLAATYMRGISCGLVPTTLLAQIDAAIGGKNGVNLDGYKNILGTFRQPDFICICPALTQTLPESEYLCGIAEMLKAFILDGNQDMYRRAVEYFSEASNRQPVQEGYAEGCQSSGNGTTLENLIRAAIDIKLSIVERDPYEKGERRLLNLGHTFGHAMEKCGGIPHGLAVATGIIMAARISTELGLMQHEDLETLIRDFKAIGLPTATDIPTANLIEAISRDKKKNGETIDFILPRPGAKAVIKPLSPEEIKTLIEK